MATASIPALVARELERELEVLNTVHHDFASVSVTVGVSDFGYHLMARGPERVRAFIPSRYTGMNVIFMAIPEDAITLDTPISLSHSHGIYG